MRRLLAAGSLCWILAVSASADVGYERRPGVDERWLTLSSNLDGGFRKTQFFEPHHNVVLVQWDLRVELWLPPSRLSFSWGPYVRFAGTKSSSSQAWEDAWWAGPGVGLQLYPLSFGALRDPDSLLGALLGPLRLFGEYNIVRFWGTENQWRPDRQARFGADYWKALHVNDNSRWWWLEIWSGFWWQSANEIGEEYATWVGALAGRFGLRLAGAGMASLLTPYLAAESTRTANDDFHWENRLLVGGGLRVAPPLASGAWLSRLVVYGEILHAVLYYGATAPAQVPRNDVRFGVSASFGDWYR